MPDTTNSPGTIKFVLSDILLPLVPCSTGVRPILRGGYVEDP